MLTLAADADLPLAVELINGAYRGETARQGWTHEADYIDGERTTLDTLRNDLTASPAARLYLLRDQADGALLGCVWLEPDGGRIWYLGLLTVRPAMQDRQLGRSLLAEAEALVRLEGGAVVRMSVVHLRDTLIAWYERRGYRRTGERSPFPDKYGRRDDLHFVVLEKRL